MSGPEDRARMEARAAARQGPRSVTGLYGKLPAHGDFVRRNLPRSFVAPWDLWLSAGLAAARETLGDAWDAAWRDAPPWRFALPAGACGPEAVAGVLLPSEDAVGRAFPLTLAALLLAGVPPPAGEGWFVALERLAEAGRAGAIDADAVAARLPAPEAEAPDEEEPMPDRPEHGLWTRGGDRLPAMVWPLAGGLPPQDTFVLLLDASGSA